LPPISEIVENEFSAERWNGSWVSDSEYVYRNRAGALAIFSVVTGRSDVIVPANIMEEPRVFQFWLSPDQVSWCSDNLSSDNLSMTICKMTNANDSLQMTVCK
jgi:hypothetical protein